MSIRCFVAVELDRTIQKQLDRLQERFRRDHKINDSALKWVRSQNIHLTLKFLGEVPDRQIVDICAAVSQAASQSAPFDLEIGNCGCFPPRGSARVLWVGLTTGLEPLKTLQENLELSLLDLGFEPEHRPFSPHLTLARIKNAQIGRLLSDTVGSLDPLTVGGQSVAEITVFQSDLDRTGPTYTPLHHAPLSL